MNVHDDFMSLFQERGLLELANDVGLIKDGVIPSFKAEETEKPELQRKRRYESTTEMPLGYGPEEDSGKGTKKKRNSRPTPGSSSSSLASTPAMSPDKQNKGLRHFSMKVCKKVEEKGQTTYNEVADELVTEFLSLGSSVNASGASTGRFDEKNIRRRVYDALNVLMAMDIISKEKKDIRWKGLPSNAQHDLDALEREKARLERNVKKKREQLEQFIEQQVTYTNLVKRNASREKESQATRATLVDNLSEGDTKIALPFIVISTHHETFIQCEMTEDRAEVTFHFSAPFEINDDNEILKRLGLHQADDTALREMFPDEKLAEYIPKSVRQSR